MGKKDEKQLLEARAYVELIQTDGVDNPVDIDTNSYTMQMPAWYDDELYKRAQQFHQNNLFAIFVGEFCGLLAVLSVPSILKILMHTRASSTPYTAYKRYLETIFHTLTWFEHDLKPGSRSWKSLEAVRKGHILASKYTEKGGSGFITQRDMALTQFGFLGFIVLTPHKLGVQVSRTDLEAFVHFWRVIGHSIGIQDKFNLCTDSYETTKLRLQIICEEIYRPYLENTDDDFYAMSKALIEGLWCYNPMLDTDASIYFTKWLANCKNYIYFESDPRAADCNLDDSRAILNSYNWYTKWTIYLQMSSHTFLANFSLCRWYFNSQVWLAKHIIYWFPFLAFYKFGFQKSYVRILKGVK